LGRVWRRVVHQFLAFGWRALLRAQPPREKVGARAAQMAENDPLQTGPRRTTSPRWRARHGRRRGHDEADPPQTCKSGSDQTNKGSRARREIAEGRRVAAVPLTSPERDDHDANRPPPQADHIACIAYQRVMCLLFQPGSLRLVCGATRCVRKLIPGASKHLPRELALSGSWSRYLAPTCTRRLWEDDTPTAMVAPRLSLMPR
jgi:hypothetical protein